MTKQVNGGKPAQIFLSDLFKPSTWITSHPSHLSSLRFPPKKNILIMEEYVQHVPFGYVKNDGILPWWINHEKTAGDPQVRPSRPALPGLRSHQRKHHRHRHRAAQGIPLGVGQNWSCLGEAFWGNKWCNHWFKPLKNGTGILDAFPNISCSLAICGSRKLFGD